jgi:hypothetical protein
MFTELLFQYNIWDSLQHLLKEHERRALREVCKDLSVIQVTYEISIISEILKSGNLSLFIWTGFKPTNDIRPIHYAIKSNNNELVRHLYKEGFLLDTYIFNTVITYCDIETIKYFYENGVPSTEDAMEMAAGGGNLDVLKYLHQVGCPCISEEVFIKAAQGRSLEIVVFLHKEGYPISSENIINTAHNSILIQYFHENGLLHDDEDTFTKAILAGNYDIVEYLHQCSYSPYSITKALKSGRYITRDIEEFLRYNEYYD